MAKRTKYRQVFPSFDYPGRRYPDGRVLEHHLVWWRHTGNVVPDKHAVHHLNEDGKDNRISNLEIMKHGDHTVLHHQKDIRDVQLTCHWCGVNFTRQMRHVRSKMKSGQTRFFCSRSCSVKAQHRTSGRKWKHGTLTGYHYHGCRCLLCKKAHSNAVNAYQKKKRAISLAGRC